MHWVILSIIIFAGLVVLVAAYKPKPKKDLYSLPKSDKPKVDKAEGTPVSQTPDGIRWLEIANGTCPHCHDQEARFISGPCGGMSQNIRCVSCGWWFNVTAFPNGEGIAQDIGFK